MPAPPAPRADEPLRILVEGNPARAFKGVGEALAATRAMHEPAHVTLVCADRGGRGRRRQALTRSSGPLTPAEMAAPYAETDVVLKLSRVEGMFGPPLEGFHWARPAS